MHANGLQREGDVRRRWWPTLVVALLLLAAACDGGGEEDVVIGEEDEPGPPRISVAALPGYRMKITTLPIPPGPTRFVFTNVDEQKHEMTLFRLKDGVQLDRQLVLSEDRTAFAVRQIGYVPPQPLDGTGELIRNISPGSYGIVCYLRAPDGQSYAAHGMFAQFQVERGAKRF